MNIINQVQVTKDVYHQSLGLVVAAGATGTITARGKDFVWVEFDADQRSYVRPDSGGRLFQRVPSTDVVPYGADRFA